MTKNKDEILAEINEIARGIFLAEGSQLEANTTARDVPEWDSLNHIQFVVAVEKHFGIKFNFADVQRFKNVGDMRDNILAKFI